MPDPINGFVERDLANAATDTISDGRRYGREPTPAEIHSITVERRNSKITEITTPEVLAAQRSQLSSVELAHLGAIKAQASAQAGQRVPAPGRETQSLAASISHLYERQSVVPGHAILAEALNQNLGGMELRRLHAKANEAGLVGLTDEPWVHQKFATVEGLALEKWAVDFVDRTRGQCEPLGGENVQLSPRLSAEQRHGAEAVPASRDQVVCLRGAAGVGKSTVLREIYQGTGECGRLRVLLRADQLGRRYAPQGRPCCDHPERLSERQPQP